MHKPTGTPPQRPHRLVVRTSRCCRDNPGSTPGVDIIDVCEHEQGKLHTSEWLTESSHAARLSEKATAGPPSSGKSNVCQPTLCASHPRRFPREHGAFPCAAAAAVTSWSPGWPGARARVRPSAAVISKPSLCKAGGGKGRAWGRRGEGRPAVGERNAERGARRSTTTGESTPRQAEEAQDKQQRCVTDRKRQRGLFLATDFGRGPFLAGNFGAQDVALWPRQPRFDFRR